jgi:hypothetical protein
MTTEIMAQQCPAVADPNARTRAHAHTHKHICTQAAALATTECGGT